MSLTTFEKEKVLAPFLGSPLNFVPGQDPLGLLNVGELAFNKLLPGMTTVSERIRYYSFYCWFFDLYASQVGIASSKEQFKYLRRAEYLIALLAAKKHWQGVPGINKALGTYNILVEQIDLTEGTGERQATFDNTYWKNSKGVFGQNYVSSMTQMGFVKERVEGEGVFIRTDFNIEGRISGAQLAQAFQDNIGINASDTFLQVLIRGNVTQAELELFADPFNTVSYTHLRAHETRHDLVC